MFTRRKLILFLNLTLIIANLSSVHIYVGHGENYNLNKAMGQDGETRGGHTTRIDKRIENVSMTCDILIRRKDCTIEREHILDSKHIFQTVKPKHVKAKVCD